MNIKKILVGAVTGALMYGVMVTPAFAATPNWDVTGSWNFDFNSTVWGGTYSKTMTIAQDLSGNITGTGNNVPAGNTWSVTGNVSGNAINFSLNYNAPMVGYVASFVGNIQSDGSMNGTWSDVMYSDSGLWHSTSGAAAAIVVSACPSGTTQNLLETQTVNSASSVPTSSTNALSSGKDYLLVSSGTWQNSLNVADTEYASTNNWSTVMDGYDIGSYLLGKGEFDLKVDGAFIDWGGFNSSHTYCHLYTGTGSNVNFLVFDGNSNTNTIDPSWYGDNNGSLTVNIYSCDKVLPTNIDQCKKGSWQSFGVFKNQGDCVSFVATDGKNLPAVQ
jgi:hypothetical protein